MCDSEQISADRTSMLTMSPVGAQDAG